MLVSSCDGALCQSTDCLVLQESSDQTNYSLVVFVAYIGKQLTSTAYVVLHELLSR